MLRLTLVLLAAIAGVYVWNASWLAAVPERDGPKLIAHRGVHQTFSREGLESDTCTAERIHPPAHGYLENTIPSMRAAFAAGADVVELDVHPTADGYFAVLHDWTLDCRTDGTGVTRDHDLAYLKALDIGYGYTADAGTTYPFRGKGFGLMPELGEVFSEIPEGRFLVNYKSRERREGDMLARMLRDHPEWRDNVWAVYGGAEPTSAAIAQIEGLRGFTNRGARNCLLRYLAVGWSGYVPESCREGYVMVPVNFAWLMWGWPNRFQQRIRDAGSEIILTGPYGVGDPGTAGIDTIEDLARVPEDFAGYIWTNRIEIIGPALAARR